MGEDFELGKINYEAYCLSTGGLSLISGDKLPAFEDLKYEIRQAWQFSAERLFKICEKERHLKYIKLLCFEVNDDEVFLEKAYTKPFGSRYEFRYSIRNNYIIISLNNQQYNDRIETDIEVFKLDFTLLFKIYDFICKSGFGLGYDEYFQYELDLFIQHIQNEISEK